LWERLDSGGSSLAGRDEVRRLLTRFTPPSPLPTLSSHQANPKDEVIEDADALLLTVPNQPGAAYNVHVMKTILATVAPILIRR
jgi:hypothetical protein